MFNESKFNRASFVPRTHRHFVPELKDFFGESDDGPHWEVRGLTGQEMFQAKMAVDRDKTFRAAVAAMSAGGREQVAAFTELMGLGDTVPEELSKRIEILVIGSVAPKVERPTIVKLAKAFPATLNTLTDKILELTGLGHEVGKPKGSGETPASATP